MDITSYKLQTRLDNDMADVCFEYVKKSVLEFQSTLDNDHEVGVMLASFGKNITMHVTHIGYQNPNILIFAGFVDGSRAELIQHMSQLNFLLLALKKQEPEMPPVRVGFI